MQQLPRQGDSSQASAFQLLRAAPALVMHEVMPVGTHREGSGSKMMLVSSYK